MSPPARRDILGQLYLRPHGLHDIDLRSDGVDDDLCAGGGDDRGWRYRAGIVLRL